MAEKDAEKELQREMERKRHIRYVEMEFFKHNELISLKWTIMTYSILTENLASNSFKHGQILSKIYIQFIDEIPNCLNTFPYFMLNDRHLARIIHFLHIYNRS